MLNGTVYNVKNFYKPETTRVFTDDSSRPPLYQAPTRRDSMGEVSNVSTTVSRKKKSAAVIEPKRQAASGKVRNHNKYYNIRELTGKDKVKENSIEILKCLAIK